jgi:hypothetical protein
MGSRQDMARQPPLRDRAWARVRTAAVSLRELDRRLILPGIEASPRTRTGGNPDRRADHHTQTGSTATALRTER